MKTVFLLLALAGLTCGLTSNLEYVYKYFGSVATGINEFSPQSAGTAIKALIVLQVHEDGSALIQLNEVQIVEFNDKLGCDSRGGLPGPFKPVEDEALRKLIETPFKAHLFDHSDKHTNALEVDASELVWLSNVRKAVVSHLRIELLKANFRIPENDVIGVRIQSGKVPHVFHIVEETIFGKCKVDYSVHELREDLAYSRSYIYGQAMEGDVERGEIESSALTSKTSQKTSKTGPSKSSKTATKTTKQAPEKLTKKIKDNLWHVVRSVDFDHCEDRVSLQITPVGTPAFMHSTMGDGQYEWLRGRSSVSEYVLRGSGGHFRVERAAVEGTATMAPLGIKTELMQANTNQTFQLVAVRRIKTALSLPKTTKPVSSWMQSVLSFAESPKNEKPHPWINYSEKSIQGVQAFGTEKFTPEDAILMKEEAIKYLKNAADILTDIDQAVSREVPGMVTDNLQKASYLMTYLSKAAVQDILDQFFSKTVHQNEILGSSLAVDAAAASGSYFAIEAIIDSIKAGKIPDQKVMTFFMALTTHAECPANLPSLMDYVLTLNINEKPFLTFTVLVNFANYINKQCLSANAKKIHYAAPIFGDHTCDHSLIKERFFPYLTKIIQDEGIATWKKEIAVEVLATLSTPFALPILTKVVLGEIKCSDRLRKTAIYALEGWNYDALATSLLKDNVVDLLTEIYTNVGENSGVRQAALWVITSYQPDASFWHTLARSTWREPSRRMAAFTTDLLNAYASINTPYTEKMNQAASHAVKFARQFGPSAALPYFNMFAEGKAKDHVFKFIEIAGFFDERTQFPNDFYLFMFNYLGGFHMIEMEFSLMGEGYLRAILKTLKQHEAKTPASGVAMKVAQRFYKSIQETITVKPIKKDELPSATLNARVFENMFLTLPFNVETLQTLPISDTTEIATLMLQLSLGYDLVIGKYFNPIQAKTFQATELGLPLLAKISNPMVISEVSLTTAGLGEKSVSLDALKKLHISSEYLLNFASESKSVIEFVVPWSKSFVGTGVRSTRDIVVPVNLAFKGDEKSEGDIKQIISVTEYQPLYKNKYSVVKATNVPYTYIAPFVPTPQFREPSLENILKNRPKETQLRIPQVFTGFKFDLTWTSEMRFPINVIDIESFFSECNNILASPWLLYSLASPTIQMWYLDLEFDPSASDSKSFSIQCAHATYLKNETEESGQFTQEKGDFEDYSQSQQSGFAQYDQNENIDQGLQQQFEGPPQVPSESETFGGKGQVIYNDPPHKRAEKLKSQFDGVTGSGSCKFEFTGKETRSYEFMITHSKPTTSSSKQLQKHQLSFFRGPIPGLDPKPAAVYLDWKISSPVFSPLDTLEGIFSSNLDKELQAEITVHPSAKPIASLKGNLRLSDAWKARYQNELTADCDFNSFDPLYAFHNKALYDQVKLTFSYEKVCDYAKLPLLSIAFELLDMTVHEYLHDSCGTSEPSNKFKFDISRCPVRGQWSVDILRGDNVAEELHGIEDNPLISQILAIGNKRDNWVPQPDHYSTVNLDPSICAIRTSKQKTEIRTFDGFKYNLELSDCWTVAAHVCTSEEYPWYLLVRASQGENTRAEAKYVDVEAGIIVEITDHVVVNGKTIDPVGDSESVYNQDGRVLITVYKKNDFYSVQLNAHLLIHVKEDILINADSALSLYVCGLCGNNDGEPEGELVGPLGCIYGNPKEFAASWTTESDTCNLYALQEKRQNVDSYQPNCKTIDSVHDTCPRYEPRGFFQAFSVLHTDDLYCVSTLPVRFCEVNATPFYELLLQVKFRCWTRDFAPKPVIEACDKNETHTRAIPALNEAHATEKTVEISVPTTCFVK